MASSNNLASLEPWSFRPTFSDSWFSDAFTRDTETLTRALQKSLTNNNNNYSETTTLIDNSISNNNNNNNNNNNSLFEYFVKSEQIPTPTGSVSDPDTNIINMVVPKRRNAIGTGGGGKISKRKSRASKRSPTTFIAADPSNFRQMVQQVTGIQFGGGGGATSIQQQSVTSVLKPEPHRPGSRIQHNYSLGLPTLDTSAFLLNNNNNNNHHQFTTSTNNAPVVVVVEDGGGAPPVTSGGLDFGSFQSFPTLESWSNVV
ncbi:hypothetical protein AQUCO_01400929v1 [Aquilegia coerulea]|uniref:VQ domain-containing protein n=1 Tax=Aquilegia coerulea TaxID=218851 RepID=A0A2G5DYY6_AQUCA|nr:hypothetical protein AQUCO_01400929v1 [Aquilegia coerulea]